MSVPYLFLAFQSLPHPLQWWMNCFKHLHRNFFLILAIRRGYYHTHFKNRDLESLTNPTKVTQLVNKESRFEPRDDLSPGDTVFPTSWLHLATNIFTLRVKWHRAGLCIFDIWNFSFSVSAQSKSNTPKKPYLYNNFYNQPWGFLS